MIRKIQLFIPLFLSIALLFSCKQNDINRDNEAPLATVGQSSLYPSDIPLYYSASLSPEDSIQMMRNYIKEWITHKLIAQLAEKNLSNETQKQILEQVLQTRNSLYIYHYEQAMIMQRMDTIVPDSTLQHFYDTHKDIFHLQDNIVKALYIQIPLSVPNLNNVRRWYRSDDPDDFNNLEGFCFQFATKFDDFDEQWVSLDEILENLPYPVTNQERLLRTTRFIEAKDSLYQYYVRINEYALRGSEAPIEYVADEIKSTILNERKITFLQELENNIYSNALNKNEFVIY
jgi:hypothetical protein